NPDAFVVINIGKQKLLKIRIVGSDAKAFQVFRTTEDGKECYAPRGRLVCEENALVYEAPELSVTTFFAE
ncbi:MAG TPA: hypothetical protein PLS55_12885, partial [Thermogutta sp.]|nr:hypothetical protein [Thermogutta sp.]